MSVTEYYPSDTPFREAHHDCPGCADGKLWLSDDKQADECDRCDYRMAMILVPRTMLYERHKSTAEIGSDGLPTSFPSAQSYDL